MAVAGHGGRMGETTRDALVALAGTAVLAVVLIAMTVLDAEWLG